MTPLQAMVSGQPVVAYGRGSVLDTILPGVTGQLFFEQASEGLMDAAADFDPATFDPQALRARVLRFDDPTIRNCLAGVVDGQHAERA